MARDAKLVSPLHFGSESVPGSSGGLAAAMTLTDSEQRVLARGHPRPPAPRIAHGRCVDHTRGRGPRRRHPALGGGKPTPLKINARSQQSGVRFPPLASQRRPPRPCWDCRAVCFLKAFSLLYSLKRQLITPGIREEISLIKSCRLGMTFR